MLQHAEHTVLGIRLSLAGLALFLSGCVAIPIAVPKQKPFTDDVEGLLEIGATTQHDIDARLGPPTLQGGSWSLYRDTREGWAWLFCAGAYYSAGCGATSRSSTDYFLVLDFDSNGLLSAHQVFQEDGLCDARRICFERDLLALAAPAEDDGWANVGCGCATSGAGDLPSLAVLVFGCALWIRRRRAEVVS